VFNGLKAQINDLLGPILVSEDEKRPMSAGFPRTWLFQAGLSRQGARDLEARLSRILPLLWLKAGAVGPRPELARGEPEPVVLAPPPATLSYCWRRADWRN